MSGITKTPHKINFYTFYQVLDYTMEQQNIISKSIKILINNLEKEINQSASGSNLKFKIHYDLVNDKTANIEHYNEFIKKNNINVVCQAPNYFQCADWSEYFNDAIYFDSFNMKTIREHPHENVFHTPISSSNPLDRIKQAKKIFKNKELIRVLCTDDSIDSIKVEKFEIESKSNDVSFKIIEDWKANNFQNLKYVISNLTKDQVLFLDKNTFYSQGKVHYTLKNRLNFVKTFIQEKSDGVLCGISMDIRMLSDCFNDVEEIKNSKVLNFVGDDFVEKLDLQDRIFLINPKIQNNIKQYLSWYFQLILDKVLLVRYLYHDGEYAFTSNEEFLRETRKRLSMLDGKKDLFLGSGEALFFKNNLKPFISSYLVEVQASGSENLVTSLYKKQLVTKSGVKKVVNVSYPYFDFLKINNVSIEDSTFDADFYFELTTPYSEGIEIILFNNVLDTNFDYKLLSKESLQNGYYYFRYRISSTFTFFSRPENYPFDKQVVFISYSIINNDKYGILQTIKVQDVDRKFISNGWNILGFRSGVIREKDEYRPVFKDNYILVSEENRIGTIMSRPSSFTIIKVLVPLAFLACLTLYGMYLPIQEIEAIIATTTTSFLSAIALYFSTERPNPLSLTTIDLIFLLFYIFVGISFMAIFIMWFFPEYYTQGLSYTRWFLLLFTAGSIYYVYKRIKSFSPKILFDGANN